MAPSALAEARCAPAKHSARRRPEPADTGPPPGRPPPRPGPPGERPRPGPARQASQSGRRLTISGTASGASPPASSGREHHRLVQLNRLNGINALGHAQKHQARAGPDRRPGRQSRRPVYPTLPHSSSNFPTSLCAPRGPGPAASPAPSPRPKFVFPSRPSRRSFFLSYRLCRPIAMQKVAQTWAKPAKKQARPTRARQRQKRGPAAGLQQAQGMGIIRGV